MKRVFITGASSGIGLATAKLLADRGDEVWGTSRDVARIPQLPRLHPVRLDLSDNVSLGESFNAALREAGHFDVVINNAGSGHFGPAEFLSTEAVHAQFQTVVFAHIELCRLALASMRAHGGGRIINVTSLASRLPVPFMAAYNAAKAAMASFTMSLQLELKGSDIRVIDLQPGDIRTDFNDAIARTDGGDPRYTARVEQAWRVVDRNMKAAPKPELVARQHCQADRRSESAAARDRGRFVSGDRRSAHLPFSAAARPDLGLEEILPVVAIEHHRRGHSYGGNWFASPRLGGYDRKTAYPDRRPSADFLRDRLVRQGRREDIARRGRSERRRAGRRGGAAPSLAHAIPPDLEPELAETKRSLAADRRRESERAFLSRDGRSSL